LLFLLVQINAKAQIDPRKLDSLSRAIDSAAKQYRQEQDRTIEARDSAYRSQVNKVLKQNGQDRDEFFAQQKSKLEKERQQRMIRVVTGVLLLIVLAIILFRRRKPTA